MKQETPMLIGISGKARSGKDSAARVLVDEYGFKQEAFAEVVKLVALEVNPQLGSLPPLQDLVLNMGWEQAKQIPQVRQFLQGLGLAARRYLDQGVWVRAVMRHVDNLMKEGTSVVISDVRFPNEVEAIRKRGGIVIRIERPNVPISNHVSEVALDDEVFEIVIENDGPLEKLEETIRSLIDAPGS